MANAVPHYLFFLLVTGIVNSFAVFEQVNIMTNGGP